MTSHCTAARFLIGSLCALAAAGAASAYESGNLVCRFQSKQINESSGIAASARTDDYFFTHNDSGDGPFVYAVSRAGTTLAKLRLDGAIALDWEDMARGPGKDGKPALYLGDIGDNLELRPRITVYRVPEPEVDLKRKEVSTTLAGVEAFQLQYPDGAHNCETLMVHPKSGQLLLVTKTAKGESGVYAAPVPLSTKGVNRMTRLASLGFPVVNATQAPAKRGTSTGARLTTGGDISPNGKRLVVRTYEEAFEWRLNGDSPEALKAAFARPPRYVKLPAIPSGEAICYSRKGDSLLVSTEGGSAPVNELRR
jgi:hypothetical protein